MRKVFIWCKMKLRIKQPTPLPAPLHRNPQGGTEPPRWFTEQFSTVFEKGSGQNGRNRFSTGSGSSSRFVGSNLGSRWEESRSRPYHPKTHSQNRLYSFPLRNHELLWRLCFQKPRNLQGVQKELETHTSS
jgi:hypothetical protein